MEDETQQQEQSYYACNGKGGVGCALCKTGSRFLRFVCAPFRAVYMIPWITWKDALIMMSVMGLVLSLTAYGIHLYNLNPPRELPEVLKYLLSGVVGYVFAYVPASKAITATEHDRSAVLASDVGLQQVVSILQQQKEIYESKIEELLDYIEEMEAEGDDNGDQ